MVSNPFSQGLSVKVGGDSSGAIGALTKLQTALTDTRTIALGLGGVLAGAVVVKGVSDAVKAYGDFDKQMTESEAIMGDVSKAQKEELAQGAREVAKTTTVSANQAAKGYYYLASAGLDAKDSLKTLPKVAKFAQAGQLDMATATNYAVSAMKAFNVPAKNITDVTDTMTAAVTKHNQTMDQMGEAMSYVAPVASGMGVTMQETAAAIGELGDAGIQGSRAGTTLRMALSRLANPTGEMKKRLDKLGVSVRDSDGHLKSLSTILTDLQDAGASTADVMAMFGTRAGPGMQALLQKGGKALADNTKEIKKSGGITDDVAKKQMDTFNAQVKILQQNIHDLAISLGKMLVPAMNRVLKVLNKLLSGGSDLGQFGKDIAAGINIAKAAFDTLESVARRVFKALSGVWDKHGKRLFGEGGEIRQTLDALQKFWDKWGDDITTVLEAVFGGFLLVAKTALDAVLTIIEVVLDVIQGDWKGALSKIGGFFVRTFNRLLKFLSKWGGKVIDAIIASIPSSIRGAVKKALGGVTNISAPSLANPFSSPAGAGNGSHQKTIVVKQEQRIKFEGDGTITGAMADQANKQINQRERRNDRLRNRGSGV